MEHLDYLIDRKITGSITKSEANQLDQLILKKPEIAYDIEKRLNILKAINYAGNEELRASLKQIHAEEFPQKKSFKLIGFKSILSIAAIFILVISGYFILNNHDQEIAGSQAYATYYKPYKASFQSRGETLEIKHEKFKTAYSMGNYKDAITFISPASEVTNNEILLAFGISAMEEGKFMLAKNYFQVIMDRRDYFFMDHAKWYSALLNLKEGNTEEAILYIKELSIDSQADHNLEAIELLQRLE